VRSPSLYDVIHSESAASMRRAVSDVSTATETFGCQLVLHDGSTVWTYVRLARVHDTVGEAADPTPTGRAHLTFSYPLPAARLTPVRSPVDDRFRAFFENSFDAAFLTAPDGRILEANPAASAMFGYTLEELRALGRAAVVDQSDPRLATMLRDREATGVTRGHLSMRRKDGSRFEADLASSVYYGPSGEERTSVMVRDLTEHIQAQQADRRETIELARRIEALTVQTSFASSPTAIYRALLDFAMAVSPAEAMLVTERGKDGASLVDVYAGWNMGGASEEEAPPRIQSAAHDPETLDAVLREGRSTIVNDVRARRESGTASVLGPPSVAERSRSAVLLPMAVLGKMEGLVEFRSSRPGAFTQHHVAPLRLAATLAAISVNDLWHHERERQARRRAEASWRHLQEIVDQAPVMMATAGGPEHVFTSANRLYLETLGLEEIVGKRVIDVLPEVEAQGIIDILDHVYQTGEPFVANGMPMELGVRGKTTRFFFDLVYQPIRDGDGEVTGILANVNDVTSLFRANESLHALNVELREAYDQTIRSWARGLDIWDEDTAGHSQRVTDLTVALATRVGMHGDDLEHIRRGAQLHDIGKMAIPDRILSKPGKLTPDEWKVMKTHTTLGARFLEPIAYLRDAIGIPRHHHERWDGTGYPDGLAGEEIPLSARIFAVVDVYDALTSDRPYRAAWTHDEAIAHIESGAGSHFDPRIARTFLEMMADRASHGTPLEIGSSGDREP